MMRIAEMDFMTRFVRLCADGWDQGWHERNGGNLTYRLTESEKDAVRMECHFDAPWQSLGVKVDNLAGEIFAATGSGKYFRNVPLAPEENVCLVEVDDKGENWRTVWGLTKGGRPTSELPSHLMNHSVRVRATGGQCRVIYHAHPTCIIAMTYILPLSDKEFTLALWRSATECPVVFPDGVGVVEWMVPGGAAIARATSKLMEKYDAAVWAHHGLFVSGPDFDTTFGLMHTIEKAAEIYMCVRQSGAPVLQTITNDDLRAIAKDFHVTLREEFLA